MSDVLSVITALHGCAPNALPRDTAIQGYAAVGGQVVRTCGIMSKQRAR